MQRLDKHFRTLTQDVFKKHGFAQGDVLSHWAAIVGDQIGALARPERIKWPRAGETLQGGTLHLKAYAGRALDVEYAAPLIQDKVNQFLGYQAISKIKVMPTAEIYRPRLKASDPAPSPALVARLAEVEASPLKEALTRLGAGILQSSQRSPQAK
jgi:hypothetical protein